MPYVTILGNHGDLLAGLWFVSCLPLALFFHGLREFQMCSVNDSSRTDMIHVVMIDDPRKRVSCPKD
jgi:hypothetical protein